MKIYEGMMLSVLALAGTSVAMMADDTTGMQDEWVTIENGHIWTDESGNTVQAHGAGFLIENGRFYMIGEDRSKTWNPDVNMYSSPDLVHWKFENKIIANGKTHPSLGTDRMIERPKLMKNPKTGKYVVWCHWEASNYGASEAGVFQCDKINGDYEYVWGGRPLDTKSRDCNVYVDDDGTAYFISTTDENTNLGLFRLSDDYLSAVEKTVLFQGQRREAPAIVKHNGRYYMLSSACSGWDPNPCKLSYTDDLTKGWSGLKQIGNGVAYDTQAASILKIEGSKQTIYLYVGDRWQDPDLPQSKTIIFPISFTETGCDFTYRPVFDINFATGEWREHQYPDKLDRTGWTVSDVSSEETVGENAPASNILDGDLGTIWHTKWKDGGAQAPHYVVVDMGKVNKINAYLSTPRNDHSLNGLYREYRCQVSTDGRNWTTVSEGEWMPYWTRITFPETDARYVKLEALSGEYGSMAELDIFGTEGSGIGSTVADATVRESVYYTVDGLKVQNPDTVKGVVLSCNRLSDGTVKVRKLLK